MRSAFRSRVNTALNATLDFQFKSAVLFVSRCSKCFFGRVLKHCTNKASIKSHQNNKDKKNGIYDDCNGGNLNIIVICFGWGGSAYLCKIYCPHQFCDVQAELFSVPPFFSCHWGNMVGYRPLEPFVMGARGHNFIQSSSSSRRIHFCGKSSVELQLDRIIKGQRTMDYFAGRAINLDVEPAVLISDKSEPL